MFLVGFMASGKTTIGLKLANELKIEFCDLDKKFESLTNQTISAYFSQFGECGFRDEESNILCDAVNECSKKVFATGGGVVVRPDNRKLLQSQDVIYLKVPFETIQKRLTTKNKQGRPLAKGNTIQDIENLYNERQTWYEEVATLTIECNNLTPNEIVTCILDERKRLSL